jgi:hypothetical protein
MRDRFLIGFTSGVIGGITSALVGISLYILKFTQYRLLDFAATLVLGKMPHQITEIIFGLLLHWGFSGMLGVLFAYLVNHQIITGKYLWFKGGLLGLGSWFIINVLTTIYKVRGLAVIPVKTAFILATVSAVMGITMALVYEWFMKKQKASWKR